MLFWNNWSGEQWEGCNMLYVSLFDTKWKWNGNVYLYGQPSFTNCWPIVVRLSHAIMRIPCQKSNFRNYQYSWFQQFHTICKDVLQYWNQDLDYFLFFRRRIVELASFVINVFLNVKSIDLNILRCVKWRKTDYKILMTRITGVCRRGTAVSMETLVRRHLWEDNDCKGSYWASISVSWLWLWYVWGACCGCNCIIITEGRHIHISTYRLF